MLTMGRNIALGRGLSVAGGETLTNGTQPLTTFLWSFLYRLFGPERAAGVLAVLVAEVVISLGTAVLVSRLARRLVDSVPDRASIAFVAGALWFASPLVMPHTMNCLETGLYSLTIVGVALLVLDAKPWTDLRSGTSTVVLGIALGFAFWVRNDATFLIAAVCLTELSPSLVRRQEFGARLRRVLGFGTLSVLVALPWLLHNKLRFGHLMPVSGRAESLTGSLGGNLEGLPVVLLEVVLAVVPIPQRLSSHVLVVLGATIVLGVALTVAVRHRRKWSDEQRYLSVLAGLYALGFCVFYGIFFGAAWFLPRYFAPLSVLWVPWVLSLAGPRLWSARGRWASLVVAASCVTVLAMTFVSARQYAKGNEHPHFQVVDWVRAHVPEHVWVGAIQTGTLGFFHDRTVNLDGKVNVAAFEALVEKREGEYVVYDTKIEFLADWIGMRDWLRKPVIAENFVVVVEDEERNLAVLRRRERP